MKNFKEYLAESKKVYGFKVKVAGEIPENFEAELKERLEKCKVCTFEKMTTTPVQKVPLDFPNLTNKEVTVYNVVLEYPITSPEIVSEIKSLGMNEECFRVRGSEEPSEVDQLSLDNEPSKEALLTDNQYKEAESVKHKDYFGDEFNKGFLKDLQKTAKEKAKESGSAKSKPDVLGSAPKVKQDKAGTKSALGS